MKVFEKDYASVFRQIDDVVHDFPGYEHCYRSYSKSETEILRYGLHFWSPTVKECRLSLFISDFQDTVTKSATIYARPSYNRSLVRLVAECLEKQGFEVILEIEK